MTIVRLYSIRKLCSALVLSLLSALPCVGQTEDVALKAGAVRSGSYTEPTVEKLIDQGRLLEARARLRELLSRNGEAPRLLLFEAMILYRENRHSESLRVLERVLRLNYADPDVYKLIGLNLVAGGRDDLAGSYFEKAVELAPRDFMARYYLSLHQLTNKQFNLAVTSAQIAINLNPRYLDGFLVLGVAQEQLGKESDAIETYRQACQIAEQNEFKNEMPFLYLARLLISLQQFEQCLTPLKQALAINPNLAEAHALIGQTLLRFEKYEQAIGSLQEAVRLAPNEKTPHYVLMGIYQKLGRAEEARREMRIFRELEEKEKQK